MVCVSAHVSVPYKRIERIKESNNRNFNFNAVVWTSKLYLVSRNYSMQILCAVWNLCRMMLFLHPAIWSPQLPPYREMKWGAALLVRSWGTLASICRLLQRIQVYIDAVSVGSSKTMSFANSRSGRVTFSALQRVYGLHGSGDVSTWKQNSKQ